MTNWINKAVTLDSVSSRRQPPERPSPPKILLSHSRSFNNKPQPDQTFEPHELQYPSFYGSVPEIQVTSDNDEGVPKEGIALGTWSDWDLALCAGSQSDTEEITDIEDVDVSESISSWSSSCDVSNDEEFAWLKSHLACHSCGTHVSNCSELEEEKDYETSNTIVNKLSMLTKGDHVAWRRSAGAYWHHGILADTDDIIGRVEIINYNGDAVKRDGHYASVRREWVSVNMRKKSLYRIDYDPAQRCYPPEIVLERATSRLGEAKYNPFTENCEHFARWCKTGQHRSLQVEALPQRLRDAPENLGKLVSKEKAISMIDRSVNAGKRIVLKGARGAYKRVGNLVAKKTPLAIDLVDRGCERLRNGINKVEEATKGFSANKQNVTNAEETV